MTLSEIKDQVAQESEYPTWEDLLSAIDGNDEISEPLYDEVARRYAKAYAEADRKDCAEKATVSLGPSVKYDPIVQAMIRTNVITVDKASITDRPLPDML